MDPYSEILSVMRRQGKKDNPPLIQIGVMQDTASCKVGELLLESEDLLIAEHLKTGYHYAIDKDSPSLKDNDTFIEPLKEGDIVAAYKINDEKYIILERLVEV